MNADQMADVLLPTAKSGAAHVYGNVKAVNADGSYMVQLNASGVLTRCAPCCTAIVGDRVLVLIKPNGKCDAIGRLGGDLGRFDTVSVDDVLTVGGTLHITNSQDASGTADNDVALIIGDRSGNHMIFDTNEIMAKGSETTKAVLWLGEEFGDVGIGPAKYGVNKVLASTASYMNAGQAITLSEAVSAQPHGIVLVWSWYDGGAKNWCWVHKFIPKHHPNISGGGGIEQFAIDMDGGAHMAKYIYVTDTQIMGNAANGSGSKTVGGLTVNNGYWVLRYVIGV